MVALVGRYLPSEIIAEKMYQNSEKSLQTIEGNIDFSNEFIEQRGKFRMKKVKTYFPLYWGQTLGLNTKLKSAFSVFSSELRNESEESFVTLTLPHFGFSTQTSSNE